MENINNKLSPRLVGIFTAELMKPQYWAWIKKNVYNTNAEPLVGTPRELTEAHRRGDFSEFGSSLVSADTACSFLSLYRIQPLYVSCESSKSIAMNSVNNSFIYYNGATFSKHSKYIDGKFVGERLDLGNLSIPSTPQDVPKVVEKAKEPVKVLDEEPVPDHLACLKPSTVFMGVPISTETGLTKNEIADFITASSIIEKKKVNNTVTVSSTLKSGIYPQGFGNTLATHIGGVTTTCPRDNTLVMMSQPAVRNALLPKVTGVHKALLGKSSPSFVGLDGLGRAPKMSRNYTSLEAFTFLQQSRSSYGINERGVRALSSGAAYCGLIDRHSRFQEHDILCAINEYLSCLPKAPLKDPVISGYEVKYNMSLQYIKITGGSGALYNRLITNAQVPAGYGIVLDSTIKYDSALSDFRVVSDTLTRVQYARTLYVNLPSTLPTQRDSYEKLVKEYDSRSFDFIGWLVEAGKFYHIPLRSIHRGLVVYTEDPTGYIYQDLVNAMLMSNVYRNSWLLFPHMSFYEYMVARLNDGNTYINCLKKTVIFNAPYAKTVKFIDTIEGTAPVMSDGSDFIPGGGDNSLQFNPRPIVSPAQVPLLSGYWKHPNGVYYPIPNYDYHQPSPSSTSAPPQMIYNNQSYSQLSAVDHQPRAPVSSSQHYIFDPNLAQSQIPTPQYQMLPQQRQNVSQVVQTSPSYSPVTTTTTSSLSFDSRNDSLCTPLDVTANDF